MNFKPAEKMKNFEAGIFQILDKKKKELEKQGKKIYNFSVGTPDFETPECVMKAVSEACLHPENYHYSLGETEELLRLMITVSDNDAANELVRKLGFGDASAGLEVVNEFCRLHGFADTHMGRLLLAPNDMDDNYTSVNDCGKFLREMNGNVLVGSEKLLDLMRQQERTGKIPAGVPENIETANKTGELSDVENDAAIIFGENGAYTVCVMMSGLSDTSAARSVIREISAQIYEYMCP